MGESEVTLFNTPNLSVATMRQAKLKLDSLDYLLGGVGVLAMLTVAVPGVLMVPALQVRAMLGLPFGLGCYGLWWALHRYTEVTARVVAVACVLLGLYLLLGLAITVSSLGSL